MYVPSVAQGEMRRGRNHHHASLRYFGHLRLTRQPDEITPLYGGIASI
ncbi:TPA: hypothetical protein ACOWQJ_001991 [Providencia rettgeri]